MCHYCDHQRMFTMLEFPSNACDRAVRHTVADLIALLQDIFVGGDRYGHDDNFQLTPAACEGLGYLLGAIEKVLRFDIQNYRPDTAAGQAEAAPADEHEAAPTSEKEGPL